MDVNFLRHIPAGITSRIGTFDVRVPSVYGQKAMDELLGKSVLKGGKRLRPMLTYLFADYFGVELKAVDISARAIEMVHAASLAHDDVIDGASSRRGRPSINIQASNKKAVLAGDYLLASVIGELSRAGNLQLVSEMARVIELLSQGEWLQADLVLNRQYNRKVIEEIALKKTSSVMGWCAIAPSIMTPEAEKLYELCLDFGNGLGIAFQYLDDTFDFDQGSEKDSFLDLKNGQVNAVLFEWLQDHPAMKVKFEKGEIQEGTPLVGIEVAIERIRMEACEHLNHCRELLDQMDEILRPRLGLAHLEKRRKIFEFIFDFLKNRSY